MIFEGFDAFDQKSSIRVTHLLFTASFCDADFGLADIFKEGFGVVQLVSGLKINLKKCEIYPVGEMDNFEELAQVFNCPMGSLPTT